MAENGERDGRLPLISHTRNLWRASMKSGSKRYFHKTIESPVGALKLIASDAGLAAILWKDDCPQRVRLDQGTEQRNHPVLLEAGRQLNEYFAGQRRAFDLELDFAGTPFQRRVWAALLTIPYGETRSYGQIAQQIGSPAAVRAVGAANGGNPISIIAPCHRVIGSTGKLTGFAGGLDTKAQLLALEGRASTHPCNYSSNIPMPRYRPGSTHGSIRRPSRTHS
jgi:methylated-DNA-[protein]-cysteine S-methyltransferase